MQTSKLKLYRSISFLKLEPHIPLQRHACFLTIEQLEKLQKIKKVSDKLANVDDNALPFCIDEVAENVIHTTGVLLLLCHKAFANVEDVKICETIDIVTLFFRQLVVFYSRKKSEDTGGTSKKLMKNDFTCCVCSSILYTIGSYCVPPYAEFQNKKRKFRKARHTGGKALTSKKDPATETQKYTMPAYSKKLEDSRSMDIMSIIPGSEEAKKVSGRQKPPNQNRVAPTLFYTTLVDLVEIKNANDLEELLKLLNNYFDLRADKCSPGIKTLLGMNIDENILSLDRVERFTSVLIRLQKVIMVYVDYEAELFAYNRVVPITKDFFKAKYIKDELGDLFDSEIQGDIDTIFLGQDIGDIDNSLVV